MYRWPIGFQRTPDGRRVFFPWRGWGSAYIIESERDFSRLRAQVGLFRPMWILPIATYALKGLVPSLIVLAGVMIFYWVWMRYALHGLQKWPTSGSGNVSLDSFTFVLWAAGLVLILLLAGAFFIMMHLRSPANSQTETFDIVFLVGFFSLSAISIASIVMLRGKHRSE